MRTSILRCVIRNTPFTLAAACLLPACLGPLTSTASSSVSAREDDFPVIPNLAATPTLAVSTVPPSGDVNPYGVAFVPEGFPRGGLLAPGDIVVANFNNGSNAQGTGSTIVAVHPDGTQSLFFQGAPGLGLSTALGVLRDGFVIVGNVPSLDGTGVCTQAGSDETDVGQGSLMVLDRNGAVVRTLTSAAYLDGPWDLAVDDRGDHARVYVSDALSGTVVRLDLDADDAAAVRSATVIASGYTHRCDPAAFVVGPTGLALDREGDTLYVASTGDNAIYAVGDARHRGADGGTGTAFITDSAHLHGPLGVARAQNGDLLTTQGDAVNADPSQPSELVEYDAAGQFVAEVSVDPSPGAAFGLAIEPARGGFVFATVDDASNVLDVWDVYHR